MCDARSRRRYEKARFGLDEARIRLAHAGMAGRILDVLVCGAGLSETSNRLAPAGMAGRILDVLVCARKHTHSHCSDARYVRVAAHLIPYPNFAGSTRKA